MTFEVAAEAYDRFMGRYSVPLSVRFADWAGVEASSGRALDVGCGTGALTRVLVDRLGAQHVGAVDPSQKFVGSMRQEFPQLDVQSGTAEHLPYPPDFFDHVLAQLVIHFVADPVGAVREMARVARPGGVVAACVWDHATGGGPLSLFWDAAHDLDPGSVGETQRPGVAEGDLERVFEDAGLSGIEAATVEVSVHHASFEEWWEPYTYGVGTAGDHVRSLDDDARERLRRRCRELLPDGPFDVRAAAWAVRASA